MKNILKISDLREVQQRISSITPGTQRQWGTMTVQQMLCHTTDQIRLALAQKPATETASWFNRNVAIHIALMLPKIPKGITAPIDMAQDAGGLGTKPTTFANDQKLLLTAIDEFIQKPAGYVFSAHPGYGALNREQYGRFIYLHLDHHLRQFGV
ncbi:DUF1569 domain-containing protein [Spirosoma areae]